MKDNAEELIRKLNLVQLGVLKVIANSSEGVSTNTEIGDTTGTATYRLGAIITPLRRYKVDGESLILPAGRDVDEGTRWQLNEKVIKKDELKRLLVEMKI